MALPVVSQIQTSNKDRDYEIYEDSILAATKLYVDSNADDLFGENNSGCITISYKDLIDANLIKDFGRSDVSCNHEKTFVEVRKVNNQYKYNISIVCVNDEKEIVYEDDSGVEGTRCVFEPDVDAPIVKITSSTINTWKKSSQIVAKVVISDVSGLNKNISIQYYWVNVSTGAKSKVYTHNYHNKKGKEKVSYQIPTNHMPGSGKYRLVVEPDSSAGANGIQDALGNKYYTSVEKEQFWIDDTKPSCGSVVGAKSYWTNTDFTITQYCNDSHSGCKKNPYSQKFTSTTKTHTFTISDNVGNTNTCKVNVYLDKDKPTCGTITGQSTTWVNKNRTIKVACNDKSGGSGCSSSTYSKTFSTTTKTSNITIRDKAGNSTQCGVNVYVDKTKPTCGSVSNTSTTWRNQAQTITQNCSDADSQCKQSSYSTTYYNNRTSGVYIYDKAGNSRYCSYNVYVDTTPPYTPYLDPISPHITITDGDATAYLINYNCSVNEKNSYNVNQCTVNYYFDCHDGGDDNTCWVSYGPGTYYGYDNFAFGGWEYRTYKYGSGCPNGLLVDWNPNGLGNKNASCLATQAIHDYRIYDKAGNRGNYLRVINNFSK